MQNDVKRDEFWNENTNIGLKHQMDGNMVEMYN